ncbi:hypothetical protein AX769_17725 [Frondihabitans sp. PAMC 28766]|uniref:DUF885 domain-containing protein n=1 Tax=Frondihabitans sp. PAMC 28766 TaxID=1795630 RepID=UPI00078E3DDE|nr:DUF885 domain-containing protein [Frondihabitans sp. PAMC 28766]AMM21646.1 hypothetical protein AX769_17725 [Frondihabitans sp. PAMC 28766]
MDDTTTTDAALDAVSALAALGEKYFETQHTYDPYNATLLGIADFDHMPGDPSLGASEKASADLSAIGAAVEAIDPVLLDEAAVVDRSVLSNLVRGAQQDAEHSLWAANASAKSYVSRQGLVFQAVPAMTAGDAESADRYLQRLSGLAAVFDAIGDRYAVEAAQGRIPTRMGVDHATQQLTGYLGLGLDDDVLLDPARRSHDSATLEKATVLVDREVRPAMARLADRLRDEFQPIGRPDDRVGIQNVPGGEAGYVAAVARHTTTALTPDEIHAIGLEVLDEMRPAWSSIGRSALGETDFGRITERMRSDPALRFETSDQIVAVAQAALDRADSVRGSYFPAYDIPDCVIEVINPIEASNTALAYYRPPAVDGSRPGAHCLLATDPESRYRFEYESLAFHESVPGHHLQLATAQTLDIPRYRRYLDVEACSFNEGWGLYAEEFADEIGLYSDDLSRLGMLSFRALRACRLVVDTGIHHYGWSREQAIQFMWENTATTREHVTSEVDRYIAWPGQALAYMIGRREILRLRQEARMTLGGAFAISDFHGVVLGSGAVPLTVLAENVERWRTGVAAAN